MSRLLLLVVGLLTPAEEREWLIGDILEEFHHREEMKGRNAARRWLLLESLRVAGGACAHWRAVRNGRARGFRRSLFPMSSAESDGRNGTRGLVHHWDQTASDVKYALRRFASAPRFTLAAVGVLALGIAANVAVFSIANAVLLRPAGFPDPERVVAFQTLSSAGADLSASPVMFEHWRQQATVVQDVTAFRNVRLNDTSGTTPEQIRGSTVSADYFRLFGARVSRGRTFTEHEDRPGGATAVVISHQLWERRFRGSDVIGHALRLNGVSYTIVGVLDAAFRGDDFGPVPDVWVPLKLDPGARTEGHFLWVCGRLRQGVSLAQARAQLSLSTEAFRREFPNVLPTGSAFSAQPVREALTKRARPLFFVLAGAVACVLLIACSNMATLLLLQAASRRREVAVRAAIGATRGRLVRQFVTESLLLSAGGGTAGLALGWLATRFLTALGFSSLPRLNDLASIRVDWRVVIFTVATSVGTAILFGLGPALRASRVDISAATKGSSDRTSHGPARRRTEGVLVVLQVSLALVLLVGCGLFMRTVFELAKVDAGLDPDRVLTMRASVTGSASATASDVDGIVRRGVEVLRAIPGVSIVGASYGLPLEDGFGLPFEIIGRPLPPGRPFHGGAEWMAVSPGYFEALRIPVQRGRAFTETDRHNSPAVVVVNDVMARQEWPDEDPIGKHLVLGHGIGPPFQDEPVREVVGVVGSVRQHSLDTVAGAEVYEPQAQLPDVANAFVAAGTPMAWIVRTTMAPKALAPALEQALQRGTGLPVSRVRSMDEIIARSISRQRFAMWLMAGFGVAALLLAALGLYGLLAYAVEQRTREIGIRLALGAESSAIGGLIVRQGFRLLAAGGAIGLAGALALTRVIDHLLFNVRPWDPPTFVAVPVLVGVVATLAVWLPARRASRVEPVVALRYE
jgi:putative ABC transport system permease protein